MRFAVVLAAACAALVLPGSALARECGIPDANPLWVDFAVLGGWLVVTLGISARFFRWQ